ncbi:MAG: MarR family transcriptional regulator [Deltaproteobacteria bacterium]|nr:MarR family transcriptional regulator [Deltaproteobacteria bacterium]MBW2016125.1 MarR family transcriptional regulator [Deltaproteobacteria bacterium]MBW2128578.1 MarR family transcriptional regulator [Deltaproteobacteria bacterium]MBW2303146.1 MarR family transcriptional regulator [Deltaproteobacteria bacterium]
MEHGPVRHPNHQADDRLGEEVLVALRRIIRAIDMHSRYLAKHFGLTGPQLLVINQLHKAGSLSGSDIARAVSLSQATVTGILDRLEKRGLIRKVRSDVDKRRVMVSLTSQGLKLLDQAPPLLQASFLDQFDSLKPWERTLVLSALQRLVDMFDASRISAAPILTTDPIEDPGTDPVS